MLKYYNLSKNIVCLFSTYYLADVQIMLNYLIEKKVGIKDGSECLTSNLFKITWKAFTISMILLIND